MPVTDTTPGSLDGLRVLEIGTSVAAPFATQILGDLGAEILKIERKGTGDDTRSWAPPDWNDQAVNFLYLNRNKKSVVLDYKTPHGRELLERLLVSADVLVQNLRPGALAKAGFTAERLAELNPGLIYCELSGYGPTGPRASQPAYDPLIQAYSGIVSITGHDESGPARVPISALDMGTGMWAVIAVYEALRRRERDGRGCHVQLSLLQTALMWMSPSLMTVDAGHDSPGRLGSGLAGVVPYGAFPATDGDVFISAGNQDTWERLLTAIGAEELNQLEGFTSNEERVRNRPRVETELGKKTRQFTVVELVRRLLAASVPHSPVRRVAEVLTDEQVTAIGQIQPLPHDTVDDLRVVSLPVTFDGRYPRLEKAPPALGADTVAVLTGLGLTPDEIDGLLTAGAVEAAPDTHPQEGR